MNLNQLASRLQHIAPFHVMELSKKAEVLAQQGRDMIHMGIGEPDFTAPPAVVEAATRAMAEGKMQYTSATGLPACVRRFRRTTAASTAWRSRPSASS
jgi:aspartate/methionine/tyrosine aminotransferase